jgi:hypothetical protein
MRRHGTMKGMQRAELAQRTASNLETVRYYEKVELLPEPPRTASGYRSYDTTHERRLRFVRGRANLASRSRKSANCCASSTSATGLALRQETLPLPIWPTFGRRYPI